MKALGDWAAYEPRDGLAIAVHDGYHRRVRSLMASRYLEDGEASQGNIFAAGPEGASIIRPGNWAWGSHHFPRPDMLKVIDTDPQSLKEITAVRTAWAHLQNYQPHGELLAELVSLVCFQADVTYRTRLGGWIHKGPTYRRAVGIAGSRAKLWSDLTVAWGIIAVLAVGSDVLKRAQGLGAVHEAAVVWAAGLTRDGG